MGQRRERTEKKGKERKKSEECRENLKLSLWTPLKHMWE
jgi:hypothetical protein